MLGEGDEQDGSHCGEKAGTTESTSWAQAVATGAEVRAHVGREDEDPKPAECSSVTGTQWHQPETFETVLKHG